MSFGPPSRRALWAVLLIALLAAAALFVVQGLANLRATAERRLTAALHRPVTIGAITRSGGSLLTPRLRLSDVRVAGPGWTGGRPLARIAAAEVRVPMLPALFRAMRVREVRLTGVRLDLERDAQGRDNWDGGDAHGSDDLPALIVADGELNLRDALFRRRLAARFAVDARGLHLAGSGDLAGQPLRLAAAGGPIGNGPWPLRIALATPSLHARFDLRLARPLDTVRLDGTARAEGADLGLLGPVIETGLPATRPFALTATLHRDKPRWRIDDLAGHVGQSDVRGRLIVGRAGGRGRLEGVLRFGRLDFADISSAAERARAAQRRATLGPRLVPDGRIGLDPLRRLDGRLTVRADRLAGGAARITSLAATITLDHSRLRLAPLRIGLPHGALGGWAEVDGRGPTPRLAIALASDDARVEDLVTPLVAGPLAIRIRLTGSGARMAEAIGRADGVIGAYARGALARKTAAWLGGDVGQGLFGGDGRVGLRCAGARFTAHGGIAWADPLVIDTDVSSARGEGQLRLAEERILLRLHGLPRSDARLRLSAPLLVGGSFTNPRADAAPRAKSLGGVLKTIGGIFTGSHEVAPDTDCAALKARVLGP